MHSGATQSSGEGIKSAVYNKSVCKVKKKKLCGHLTDTHTHSANPSASQDFLYTFSVHFLLQKINMTIKCILYHSAADWS